MYRTADDRLITSPSDLVAFVECRHRSALDRQVALGLLEPPPEDDPELAVLRRRGDEHERRELERLRAEGHSVVEIARPLDASPTALAAAEAETVAAMAAGVDVIFQASFFDGRVRAHADFLLRVDEPSTLGPWRYDVADTKLARRAKPAALLQLTAYAEQVERIQGVAPTHVEVVTGDGERSRHPTAELAAYHRSVRHRFEAVLDRPPADDTYPDPVSHCAVCPWAPACEARRRADDHLSLVAGMRGPTAAHLAAAGIDTAAALAATTGDGERVSRVGDAFLARLRHQARLQRRAAADGTDRYALLPPPRPGLGLAGLPAPSPGDVFLDLEGDPWAVEGGLEYLWGLVTVDTGEPTYHAYWGHDPVAERTAFEAVIDLLVERRRRWPDLHVYHYAPYELTACKRLAGRYASRQAELDVLLRSRTFVDLYAVVRHGLRTSLEGYGLKKLEAFYLDGRDGTVSDGGSSIVVYEEWLETGNQQLLDDIEAYNAVDCRSTLGLRNWLEARRVEVAAMAGTELGRPGPVDGTPSAAVTEADAFEAELAARLGTGLPADPATHDAAQHATWLLAQLVGFHRREQKPEWWAHFDRLTRTDAQLVDDSEAIGELAYEGVVGQVKQSQIHRYHFDPAQEHKVRVGDTLVDPATEATIGTVHAIDSVGGVLDLKRQGRVDAPRSVVPRPPISPGELPRSVGRVAEWVAEHGIDQPGPFRAVRDLLLARPPRLVPSAAGRGHPATDPEADPASRAVALALALDDGCLAVQGPPGAGKTHTGAELIVALVRAGHTVGISGPSHKAIANLLEAVCHRADDDGGRPLRCLQKADEADQVEHRFVELATNDVVEAALAEDAGAAAGPRVDIVTGTTWLFSRPALVGALHTLVIDEAGQLPLANAVAAGAAAHNLVLLGDPQQLRQPGKGTHPLGSDASALSHLLGDQATLRSDLGVFLDRSYRMHPDVCSFVSELAYDGRLRSVDACAGIDLEASGTLNGTGVRWVPVDHVGNRTRSDEEVAVVVDLVADLLGATFVDRHGQERFLTLDDVLVVAPYNAQVNRLTEALPAGARVGTVDRFQGQEAPVVVCSLAASSAADAPRGPSFLLDRHRLNVAVSRAQALAVVVASPALLATRCSSARQVPLVNALCRLVEVAEAAQTSA